MQRAMAVRDKALVASVGSPQRLGSVLAWVHQHNSHWMPPPSALMTVASALACAARRWPVFPAHGVINGRCTCNQASCPARGKHPITVHGFKDASVEVRQILAWWRRWPHANLAVVTGLSSGVIVIDVDPRHGGDDMLHDLEQQHGPLPDTVTALTGGGGIHYFFSHPGPGWRIRNDSHGQRLGPGLDIRGDGGYVILPPSQHASGQVYAWDVCAGPQDVPVAALPAWLFERLADRDEDPINRPEWADQLGAGELEPPILEGQRNSTLTSCAGSMRRRGMTRAAIEAALLEENRRCQPPLSKEEVSRIAQSVSRYRPQPVVGSDDQPPAFPLDVLPRRLQRFVTMASAHFPCPPDFLAVPLLVLLGAAIGRTRVLEMKPGWTEPSRLWWGLVSPPGTLKSPSLKLASQWTYAEQERLTRE